MDLKEAENVFRRAIEEDVDLRDNMSLLRKFISSWIKTLLEEVKSVPVLLSWYKKNFLEQENPKSKENCCILAVIILETLLENDNVDLVAHSHNLFAQAILPLHEMITSYQCGEKSDPSCFNIEMILSLYKIHWKLSQNAQHVQYLKKYGLWKALMLIYVKNKKFSLPIQNICTEYLCNLLVTECMPGEVYLLLDMVTTCAKIIKDYVEAGCYNDQILFRSLRLINHMFVENFFRLNPKSFNLISRKCHLLCDTSLKIAFESKNSPIIKYALFVHLLLKYCAIAGDESGDSQLFFENLIHSVGDILLEPKFFKYVPDVFSLLNKIFFDPVFQNLWMQIQVTTCDLYSKHLTLSVDSNFHEIEVQQRSEIISRFFENYKNQLAKSSDLSDIVESILKSTFNNNFRVCESNRSYLIRFMNSILISFLHHDSWLSSDLCSFLINTIHAIGASLAGIAVPCHTLNDLLETSVGICKLNSLHRMDIKIAAFNLCSSIVKQKTKLSVRDVELLKNMMIESLRDDRWEVRDCVLELLAELLPTFSEDNSNHVMSDPQFFEIFSKTLLDEESYVRASAYKVLTALVSLPISRPPDYDLLLSQTLAQFPKETEGNVRVNMVIFAESVWRNNEITNTSLLENLYETIYFASSNDLYEEVRISGMLFWEDLVRSAISDSGEIRNQEFFEKLACIGCLEAVMNALEDEYDLQVVNTALNILSLLLSPAEYLSGNLIQPHRCTANAEVKSTTESVKELKNLGIPNLSVNFIVSAKRPSHYVSEEDFFKKYNKSNFEQIKNDKLVSNETLNLENLIHNFKKVTFDASVNEKDCY